MLCIHMLTVTLVVADCSPDDKCTFETSKMEYSSRLATQTCAAFHLQLSKALEHVNLGFPEYVDLESSLYSVADCLKVFKAKNAQ